MKKGTLLDKLKLCRRNFEVISYMLKLEVISFKITIVCSLHSSMIEGHRQSLMPFLIALSNASHAMHQSKLTSYLIYVLFVARSASEFMCLKMLFFFPIKRNKFRTVLSAPSMYTWNLFCGCIQDAQCMRNIIRYIFSNLRSILLLVLPSYTPLAARTECNKKLMNV